MPDCSEVAQVPCRYPCAFCTAVGVIASAIMLIMSFSSLDPTQLGLNYSFFSASVEDKGYMNGRYMLGPGHSFIKFPGTVQTIQFSDESDSIGPALSSRTSDGLEVTLEVSFQYQLNVTSCYDVYEKFGTDYASVYTSMSMDIITSVATQFNATAFFNDRTTIGLAMEDELKSVFGKQAYSSIAYFQLRKVTLPKDFEDSIQDTEVKRQDIATASAEMLNQEVVMQTAVKVAEQSAIGIGIDANATALATLAYVDAYVKQFNMTQTLQAVSFVKTLTELGGDESKFLEYMRMRAVRDHPAPLSVVSIPQK